MPGQLSINKTIQNVHLSKFFVYIICIIVLAQREFSTKSVSWTKAELESSSIAKMGSKSHGDFLSYSWHDWH